MSNQDIIINACVKAYVSVMGVDKWNSLSEQQQHDVIMILVRDFTHALSVCS